MVPELHAMRIVCSLKAVFPAWVTDTVSFTVKIHYIHCSDSFEVLQAKVNCLLSVGPARPVPRALNKHYSARSGPIIVLRLWLLSEHLGQVSWSSGHPMAIYVTFGAYLLRVHTPHSVPKIYANGLLSYELTIPYLIQLVPCLVVEFVGRPRSLPVLIARDCGEIRGRVLRIESWVNTSSMRNFSSIGLALPNKAGVVFFGDASPFHIK